MCQPKKREQATQVVQFLPTTAPISVHSLRVSGSGLQPFRSGNDPHGALQYHPLLSHLGYVMAMGVTRPARMLQSNSLRNLPVVASLRRPPMLLSLRASALIALAVATASLHQAVESRLIYPFSIELQAYKLRRSTLLAANDDLPARIQSYFAGSGFPQAGRSLQQKIDEADAFLAEQFPKLGLIGVGTAVVYQDKVVYAKGYGLRRYDDSTSTATKDDIFQIGSVSKTFIALGVGLLVDDGKLQWTDPVKKHMPWLKLFDKYAQEHLRIGDLLSMNSGFGRSQDPPIYLGAFSSARSLIEGLEFAEPEFPLRDTPAYANVNYEILGQLIEEVSGKPWGDFLRDRIWKPLGMSRTFASVDDVPSELEKTALNAGHLVCSSNVVGPLEMINSTTTNISPGYDHLAAGSIVSTPADMTKLLRLVLNKGTVDGVQLFKSPATIAKMITGKNINALFGDNATMSGRLGYAYLPDGNSLSAGYGFDFIGNLLWGHAYIDKGGDTLVHHTTTGYAPNDGLALVMLANSEGMSTVTGTDQLRSYVMGIFLDVPKEVLDFQFAKWQSGIPPQEAPFPGAPVCGFQFWKNPPSLDLPTATGDALIGDYEATNSAKYFPRATITRATTGNQLLVHFGQLSATLLYVGNASSTLFFIPDAAIVAEITAAPDATRLGNFIMEIVGQTYRKV
jgi:CubicO group peptidase (beta-lactamase class C family)